MCGHVWIGNGSLCPSARCSTSHVNGCAGLKRGRATSSCACACVSQGTGNARPLLGLERGQLAAFCCPTGQQNLSSWPANSLQLDAILRPFLPKRSLRSAFPVSELGVQFRIFPTNQYILSINY